MHEGTKGEPEGVEEGVLVLVLLRVLLAVWRLLPLIRGESGEYIDDEGDEDKNEEGVDVDVRREGVEEGEKTWRSRAGRNVQDGDAQVQPGWVKKGFKVDNLISMNLEKVPTRAWRR